MQIYDAIVIGGGPAGSTAAAVIASSGQGVLLLEKGHSPSAKLCGEFITPECTRVFKRLGVLDQIHAAKPQVINRMDFVAPDGRTVKIPIEWLTTSEGIALGLSRSRLDAILLERAAGLGVEVRHGAYVSPVLEISAGHRVVEANCNGERELFRGRIIIDASGHQGAFAHQSGPPKGKRLFACSVHVRGVTGVDQTGELYFFRNGYGGLSGVEPDSLGSRSNLCFLTDEGSLKAARGNRQQLLETTILQNPVARQRLAEAELIGDWSGTGPLRFGRRARVPGVISVGDAAAFIDPFTGSGIHLALASGELAGRAIAEAHSSGEARTEVIERRYQEFRRALFGWRFHAARMLRRIAVNPIPRSLVAPLLERHAGVAKLLAKSTRVLTRAPVEEPLWTE